MCALRPPPGVPWRAVRQAEAIRVGLPGGLSRGRARARAAVARARRRRRRRPGRSSRWPGPAVPRAGCRHPWSPTGSSTCRPSMPGGVRGCVLSSFRRVRRSGRRSAATATRLRSSTVTCFSESPRIGGCGGTARATGTSRGPGMSPGRIPRDGRASRSSPTATGTSRPERHSSPSESGRAGPGGQTLSSAHVAALLQRRSGFTPPEDRRSPHSTRGTGAKVWSTHLPTKTEPGSVILAGGRVFTVTLGPRSKIDGVPYYVDAYAAADGRHLWRTFVGSEDGYLMDSTPAATAQLVVYRHRVGTSTRLMRPQGWFAGAIPSTRPTAFRRWRTASLGSSPTSLPRWSRSTWPTGGSSRARR